MLQEERWEREEEGKREKRNVKNNMYILTFTKKYQKPNKQTKNSNNPGVDFYKEKKTYKEQSVNSRMRCFMWRWEWPGVDSVDKE